jgi:hypothetical protein
MKLIDAEQIGLTDMEIIMCDGNYKKALEMLIDKIANAPSIDAEQVIRCRDCKHYAGEGKRCDWDICVQVDRFYCYYGERKES